MTSNRWTLTLLALALGAAGGALPSDAAEYRCWNGDLVRRIELRGTGMHNASCEVRYWRNAATAGAGQSLWRSDSDLDYCAARARELIARLQSGGWRCASSEPATPAGEADGGSGDQEEGPPADVSGPLRPELQPRSRDLATSTETFSPDVPTTAQPGAPAARPPSLDVARTAPSVVSAAPPSPAVAQTAPSLAPAAPPPSPAVAQAAPSHSDHLTTATSEHPNAALLDRVVEQTLRSVQELYGGQFQADLATFGDLDRDGLKDAAVLVTYQADRKDHVQYLVAYLFDGETFRSVATKNVGGRFLDAVRADLQGIVDGRILVELEALDEDANCCARQRTAFALENGQLVQVAAPDAAGLEPTSHIERRAPG